VRYSQFVLVTAYLRCARCLKAIGPTAPVMGHAVYGVTGSEWLVSRWKRRPGNSGRARHNDVDTDEVFVPGSRSQAIELRCRRCRYAPRISLRRIAEQAAAADYRRDHKAPDNGTCDLYV
jgi:hypothetical protein